MFLHLVSAAYLLTSCLILIAGCSWASSMGLEFWGGLRAVPVSVDDLVPMRL